MSPARYIGSVTSDSTFAMIPSLSARYKDWLVSASYFKQSYTLPDTSYDVIRPYVSPMNPGGSNTSTTASHTTDREEYDINVGYYFLPGVAVSLGYKSIKLSHSYTYQWIGAAAKPGAYDVTYKTPIIGIQASSQLGGSSFYLYGNGAISIGNSLTREDTSNLVTPTSDGSYSAAELGVGYAISKNMVFSIGTKYQVANVKDSDTSGKGTMRDVTSGVTAGISYTF